jgi:hypothetical protein
MSQDRFLYLLDDVEALGGTHLPERCDGLCIDYESGKPAETHACKKEFRLLIPYDGVEQKDGPAVEKDGLATVCAEGDRVDLWPRLQPEAL